MAEIYQWKAGSGRRLFNAKCPKCGNDLSQTCFDNLKNPQVMESEPRFVLRSWEKGYLDYGCQHDDYRLKDHPDTGEPSPWCDPCDDFVML